ASRTSPTRSAIRLSYRRSSARSDMTPTSSRAGWGTRANRSGARSGGRRLPVIAFARRTSSTTTPTRCPWSAPRATVPTRCVVGGSAGGRARPLLRGVTSTRVWIKPENVACERLLLERCEPLDALTGGTARDELRDLWRMLLQNHPHDSICGCSIDAVHDVDMAPRFAYVREHGEALASRLLERLAGRGSFPMLWKPLPWART